MISLIKSTVSENNLLLDKTKGQSYRCLISLLEKDIHSAICPVVIALPRELCGK